VERLREFSCVLKEAAVMVLMCKAARSQSRVISSLLCGGLLLAGAQACGSSDSDPKSPTPTTTAPAPVNGGTMVPGAGGTGAPPVGPIGTTTAPPIGTTAPPVTTAGTGAPPVGGGAPMMTTPPNNTGMPVGGTVDWGTMGYDLGSTYYNTAETKLTKDNAAGLEIAYQIDMGGNVYSVPLQVGDKIYAAGPSSVRMLDAATGMELWSKPLTSTASLAYDNGTLYANTNGGSIVALNAADGMMKWSKKHHATQTADGSASPLVAGDLVLIGGSNGGIELGIGSFRGYMSALNKNTGDIVWTEHTVPEGANGASFWSSPSADLAAGLAFGGSGNNYGPPATDTSDAIIAFDLMKGTIKWKSQRVKNDTFGFTRGGSGPDSDIGANPVLYEAMVGGQMTKLVSAGAKGGTIHAVRRDDGMEVWTRSICTGQADGSTGIFVNSTWSGKHMLFACNKAGGTATLFGVDGGTGEVKWMRDLTGPVWGRMSVANGVGFVGTGTNLEAFDVETGGMLKSIAGKGGTIAGTISISNGRVAFGEGFTWGGGKAGRTLTVLKVP
jgi:outer membrane protein assembly factor BamB